MMPQLTSVSQEGDRYIRNLRNWSSRYDSWAVLHRTGIADEMYIHEVIAVWDVPERLPLSCAYGMTDKQSCVCEGCAHH